MNNSDLDRLITTCFNKPDALIIVALMFLSKKEKSIIPELMTLFNSNILTKFLYMYGGETIKIPTVKEFNFLLTCSISLYYRKVKRKNWSWIYEKLEILEKDKKLIQRECNNFIKKANKGDLEFIENIFDTGDILQ